MEENELFINCKLSNLENRRKVHVRNYMFNKQHLCKENVHNINSRLHDGPVFKITHPNGEIIKRNTWYGGAIELNNLDGDFMDLYLCIKSKEQYYCIIGATKNTDLKVDVGDHCSATWCIVIF